MNKVLILIPDSLNKVMGGMGEQARNVLEAFPASHHFDVVGSHSDKEHGTDNYHFYPVTKLNVNQGKSDPLSDTFLNQSLYVERALTLQKPDIVHAFDWSTFYAGRLLAKHWDIPLVVTVQLSIDKHIDMINPMQKLQHNTAVAMEYSGLTDADQIIQVSENYASLFPSVYLDKTNVIHNGINLNPYKSCEKEVKLPGSNKNKLVYIGRYADMKNIDALLKAKIPENTDIIFIGGSRGGDEVLFQSMLEYCKEHENAYYVGEKYGSEKIAYLKAADFMIVPSKHEPFGIVALEALASKSILLSSFVNGMGDFLNKNAAINCGVTPDSITEALQKVVELSTEEKDQMISEGLKICENHKWSEIAKQVKQVYYKAELSHALRTNNFEFVN